MVCLMRVTILFFRVISFNGDTINTVENHVTRHFKFLFCFNFYRLFYFLLSNVPFESQFVMWVLMWKLSIPVLKEKSYFTILIYLHNIPCSFFLFYFIPFRFIPFHSVPFRSVTFSFVSFHSVPLHSNPFYIIPNHV